MNRKVGHLFLSFRARQAGSLDDHGGGFRQVLGSDLPECCPVLALHCLGESELGIVIADNSVLVGRIPRAGQAGYSKPASLQHELAKNHMLDLSSEHSATHQPGVMSQAPGADKRQIATLIIPFS